MSKSTSPALKIIGFSNEINGVPKGIRTPVTAVKGRNLHLARSEYYDKLFNN